MSAFLQMRKTFNFTIIAFVTTCYPFQNVVLVVFQVKLYFLYTKNSTPFSVDEGILHWCRSATQTKLRIQVRLPTAVLLPTALLPLGPENRAMRSWGTFAATDCRVRSFSAAAHRSRTRRRSRSRSQSRWTEPSKICAQT